MSLVALSSSSSPARIARRAHASSRYHRRARAVVPGAGRPHARGAGRGLFADDGPGSTTPRSTRAPFEGPRRAQVLSPSPPRRRASSTSLRRPPRGVWDDFSATTAPPATRSAARCSPARRRPPGRSSTAASPRCRLRSPLARGSSGSLLPADPQPCLVVGPSARAAPPPSAPSPTSRPRRLRLHRNADRVRHVWQVSGKRIIAGMSYLGDWQRCLDLVAEACARRAILLATDLHHFVASMAARATAR